MPKILLRYVFCVNSHTHLATRVENLDTSPGRVVRAHFVRPEKYISVWHPCRGIAELAVLRGDFRNCPTNPSDDGPDKDANQPSHKALYTLKSRHSCPLFVMYEPMYSMRIGSPGLNPAYATRLWATVDAKKKDMPLLS